MPEEAYTFLMSFSKWNRVFCSLYVWHTSVDICRDIWTHILHCVYGIFLFGFRHFLSVNKYFFPKNIYFQILNVALWKFFFLGSEGWIYFCYRKTNGFYISCFGCQNVCWNNVGTFFKVFFRYIFLNNNYNIISYSYLCGKFINLYIYPYTTCHISIRHWKHNKWWDHSLVCCLKGGVLCL